MKEVWRGLLSGLIAALIGLIALSVLTPAPGPQRMAGETAPASAPALDRSATPDSTPSTQAISEPVGEPAPETVIVEVPAGSEFNRPSPEGDALIPGTEETPDAAGAPEVAMPSADTLPAEGTQPAPAPETADVPGAMTAPAEEAGDIALATSEDSEVVLPGTRTPAAPTTETGPATPANPPTPSPAPEMTAAPTGEEEVAVAVPSSGSEQPAPKPQATTLQPATGAEPAPTADEVTAVPSETAGPEAGEPPAAEAAPGAVAGEESGPALPSVEPPGALRVPVPGRELAKPNVRVNRLPTIGGDDADGATPAVQVEPEEPIELGALARYAAPFEPMPGKPLFSVILIEAEGGLDRETLMTFSFPVTFAIDASRPDATQSMRAYRDAGFEVVLLAGSLPEGATASDLEVAMAAYQRAVPEAVAVLDSETGGLQGDRQLLRALMGIVKESGQGVVTYGRGLNAAGQIAEAAKVPATTVFRVLDGERESVPTIRRYLDRAAFKAAQDGHVVLVGHSYPETVTALFSWALEGKGAEVSLAPLSAVLRRR